MTVADSLITLLAPQIGEERAKYLLLDFIKVSTVRGRVSRAEHRAEVLRAAIVRLNGVAESAPEPQQLGLNHAVGVLLDMVTSRDESAGGTS